MKQITLIKLKLIIDHIDQFTRMQVSKLQLIEKEKNENCSNAIDQKIGIFKFKIKIIILQTTYYILINYIKTQSYNFFSFF